MDAGDAPLRPDGGRTVSDEIDPEIAALIGGSVEEYQSPGQASAPKPQAGHPPPPDFTTLFGDMGVTGEVHVKREFDVDLSRKSFAPVERTEAESPASWFADPSYYKNALNGEGDEAQKVHELLGKYLKPADPKDKGIYRQQLVSAYWYLAAKAVIRSVSPQSPLPKRIMVRFGAVLPNLLSPELMDCLHKVVFEKEIDEPVYYIDEWIRAVAAGQIQMSATDEVRPRHQAMDETSRYQAILQRAQGKRDAAEGLMKSKTEERRSMEALLREKVETICRHESQPGFLHVPALYTEPQKRAMSELNEVVRRMLAVDKELVQTIGDFERAGEELKGESVPETKANAQSLAQEFETVKQMTKLCIGRQGNQFPILSREYFHGGPKDIGTRENVVRLLTWIESIDCEAFCRPYKNTLNRIVPYILLVPCYGDQGICWEPFDRFNRATSRGRVAVPLYPKSLNSAVIYAVADLRWQVAKEKASYYWMEEGLTGNYYQFFTSKKIKGDVKEYFVQDYITWITKESEGIQKLEKEVRAMFWRYMPFSKEIKEKLKTRSYVYQELYQKDINRSLSDGY
jgi:hypothetical protein